MSTRIIKGACPKCHESIDILVEGEPDGKLNVICDYCGINKKLTAFTKELSRQEERAEQLRLKAKADREVEEKRNAEYDQIQREYKESRANMAKRQKRLEWQEKHGEPLIRGISVLSGLATVCLIVGIVSLLVAVIAGSSAIAVTGVLWLLAFVCAYGFTVVCVHLRKATHALHAIRDSTGFNQTNRPE